MRFKIAALAVFLAPMLMPAAAQAYDPLCNKVKNPTARERCKCSSDVGMPVLERSDERGNTQVFLGQPGGREAPALHDCMMKKGIFPG